MRTKVTFVLLFLNAALFFVIFHFERSWRTENAAGDIRQRVLGAEAADIRTLNVESAAPGGSFSLERRGEAWFLTRPVEWRANQTAVMRIVSDLEFLEHETSFEVAAIARNGQSLADYGLAPPKLTVSFTSGGADTTGSAPVTTRLAVGETTKVGQRLYVLSPDGRRIHVVGREFVDGLSASLEQLRAETVLTIPVFEARALNLQTAPPAGVHVVIQREGARWSFETPIPARADKDAIELAINDLDALRVKGFVAADAPVPPEARLRATIEGNNRYETLFLGSETPASANRPPGAAREYYAQLEDSSKPTERSGWFTVGVPDALLGTLRNAQESLRDRHVLDFDPALVTMISLRAPGQPAITLQRLEPDSASATPADSARWQIVQSGGGAQGPSTLAADDAAVRALLDQLGLLAARQFKSDAPQASDLDDWGFNRPERTIVINQQPPPSSGGAPAPARTTLEIGRATQRNDPYVYARLANALSVYAVDPEILGRTEVSPLRWRERLLFSLPAAARITALEITDLKDNRPVVRWSAASGETPPPPERTAAARGAAIQTVIGRFRSLRAAHFTRDAFADNAAAGAGDRPWRYRLQATIALPGGAGGEQTGTRGILMAERTGGAEQIAGSPEIGAEFALEQPLVDALWTLIYGARDPGPPSGGR